LIAKQIQFVGNAPDNKKAMKLSFNAYGPDGGKATLSKINATTGFATSTATAKWSDGFYMNFQRYRDTATNTTVRIGIQSTDWATSQVGYTASTPGESVWDLCLTYQGNNTPFHTWETVGLTTSTATVSTPSGNLNLDPAGCGTWKLSFQSNRSKLFDQSKPGANFSLAGWANDVFWGAKLFGAGAKVTSIQIGAGSFPNTASTGYVSYLETNLLNNGDRIEFVPEPGTLSLVFIGGLTACIGAWLCRRTK
jgi:hypothetical protein